MASDNQTSKGRGVKNASKGTTTHPYAAIEHRVIDSPAYANLTFSARALLVQIVRQLTMPNNNGHLQATFTYMERFGFSVNTLSRATHELITHGFIYKAKSGGFHQGAAQFAVTWLSITKKDGIFLQGFKLCAWRDWQPENNSENNSEKKSRPPKVRAHSLKNGEQTPPTVPKNEATPPPKSEHNELVPIYAVNTAVPTAGEPQPTDPDSDKPQSSNQGEAIREFEEDHPVCHPMTNDARYSRVPDEEQFAGYGTPTLGNLSSLTTYA